MAFLFLGIVALGLAFLGSQVFVRANPAVLARVLRRAAGLAILGVALLLLVTGRVGWAIPAGLFGVSLLGSQGWPGGSMFTGRSRSAGQGSRVRGAFVEMTLDHDTGDMRGRVLRGRQKGRSLDDLSEAELRDVLMEARGDADSIGLLEAYLDRRMPGWREDVERDGDAGSDAPGAGSGGTLALEEALEILGLQPGATAQEIGQAHRAMMKRVHPDFGGSASLAARVNAAKDVALRHTGVGNGTRHEGNS